MNRAAIAAAAIFAGIYAIVGAKTYSEMASATSPPIPPTSADSGLRRLVERIDKWWPSQSMPSAREPFVPAPARSAATLAADAAWLGELASDIDRDGEKLAEQTAGASMPKTPESLAWAAASLPGMYRLAMRELPDSRPTLTVLRAFDGVRIEVSSGWLTAAQELSRARGLVDADDAACSAAYLGELATDLAAAQSEPRLGGNAPGRRPVPAFQDFVARASYCMRLRGAAWPTELSDTRADVEAGLVWWIGRRLAIETPTKAPTETQAPCTPVLPPLSTTDRQRILDLDEEETRACHLLQAFHLDGSHVDLFIALYRLVYPVNARRGGGV